MSEDTRIREAARQREKMLFDEGAALSRATRKGREAGIQEGKQTGRQEIIEKFKKSGMSEDEINRILNS